MPIDFDQIQNVLRRGSRTALTPLFRARELKETFKEPPKDFRKLPGFYVEHLKSLFKDPKKLKLALTDVTPLSLAGLASAGPALAMVAKLMPHRKVQTYLGGLGNILGGQLMQRTGIIGGSLGGLAGEAVGRMIGAPFDRTKLRDAMDLATSMAQPRAMKAQMLEERAQGLVPKMGMEHQGIREPSPTVSDASIGGSNPRLADVPRQYGTADTVKNRGKWRPDIDTLLEAVTVLTGNTMTPVVSKNQASSPSAASQFNQLEGLHHDPLSMYHPAANSIGGIGGLPGKNIKDREIPET